MCGRLNQFAKLPALSLAGRALRIERRKKEREDKKAAAQVLHNICPTDYADVMMQENGELGMERMRFGLIPAWAKGSKAEVAKKFLHTFNARCESVFELASYRRPIMQQRCLIPVRGWHEWPASRTPYFIHHTDDAPLLLAGIWDVWESRDPADEPSGPLVTSMSVITTPPGRYMGKFHDRSPLILEGESALTWLQPDLRANDLRALFKPYESEHLEAYRVSTLANQARNKTEAVCAPISPAVPQAGYAPVAPENEEIPLLESIR
ncbi:MAG: SOS response-associated peptidase [Verrucomicrobiaceae bacterium]|nr:SOS response-associated peptidase [Verrucomicrobiaceae bacterium]